MLQINFGQYMKFVSVNFVQRKLLIGQDIVVDFAVELANSVHLVHLIIKL